MDTSTYSHVKRSAFALTLAGSAWLVLSAWMPFGLTPSSAGAAPAAGQNYIQIAQADTAPVEQPVSYSSDQANRGHDEFTRSCVECHGDDLRGGLLGGPPLRGLNFEDKYANGLPAGILFEVMSSTMPPDAPGRYSPEVYADLMAYILERNNFVSGAPLPSDVDALYNLTMDK